jgi:hypothetical protein
MTEPMTAEQLKEIIEKALHDLNARLRVEFDKELLGYAKIFDACAELRPDIPEAPGYRAAAQMLRKAMEPDDASRP